MKERFPPALKGRKDKDDPPGELDLFVDEQTARTARLEAVTLSSDCSLKDRRDALAEIKGIYFRLGSMLMKSPEIIAEIEPEIVAETKAKGAATARKARHPHSDKRDPIINEALRANPTKPRKLLAEDQRHVPEA